MGNTEHVGDSGGECVRNNSKRNNSKAHRGHAEKGVGLLKKPGLHSEDSESLGGWV